MFLSFTGVFHSNLLIETIHLFFLVLLACLILTFWWKHWLGIWRVPFYYLLTLEQNTKLKKKNSNNDETKQHATVQYGCLCPSNGQTVTVH